MKKHVFIDDVNDYDIEIEGKTISIFYSADSAWNNPNTFIMSITDTGNGLKVKTPQKTKNHLEYDQALEFGILLRVKYLLDGYKIEMVDNIIEL